MGGTAGALPPRFALARRERRRCPPPNRPSAGSASRERSLPGHGRSRASRRARKVQPSDEQATSARSNYTLSALRRPAVGRPHPPDGTGAYSLRGRNVLTVPPRVPPCPGPALSPPGCKSRHPQASLSRQTTSSRFALPLRAPRSLPSLPRRRVLPAQPPQVLSPLLRAHDARPIPISTSASSIRNGKPTS